MKIFVFWENKLTFLFPRVRFWGTTWTVSVYQSINIIYDSDKVSLRLTTKSLWFVLRTSFLLSHVDRLWLPSRRPDPTGRQVEPRNICDVRRAVTNVERRKHGKSLSNTEKEVSCDERVPPKLVDVVEIKFRRRPSSASSRERLRG